MCFPNRATRQPGSRGTVRFRGGLVTWSAYPASEVFEFDIFGQNTIMFPMIIQSQNRPSTSLRLLCDEAAKHGIPAEACLEHTSVSIEELDDPNAVHSTTDEIQAIENLVRLAPENVGLGFAVGRATHVHCFRHLGLCYPDQSDVAGSDRDCH